MQQQFVEDNNSPNSLISDDYKCTQLVREAGVTIVVGRQFGCGGRTLGKLLAQRLKIPYFDKELLATVATRLGLNQEILERIDERRPSFVRSIFSVMSGATSADYSVSSMNTETLYGAQAEVIRQIGMGHPCVFVGRTADYILRENPKMFSIFLHATMEQRVKIISNRDNCCEEKAKEKAVKCDKCRREYYNYFTGRNWGAATNYDLCINTSNMEIDDVANLVLRFIAASLQKKKQIL